MDPSLEGGQAPGGERVESWTGREEEGRVGIFHTPEPPTSGSLPCPQPTSCP